MSQEVKELKFEASRKWSITGKIDEKLWDEEAMEEFREVFFDYHTHEELLEYVIRTIISRGRDGFVEGFGYIKVNGAYPSIENIKEGQLCTSVELFVEDLFPDVEFTRI